MKKRFKNVLTEEAYALASNSEWQALKNLFKKKIVDKTKTSKEAKQMAIALSDEGLELANSTKYLEAGIYFSAVIALVENDSATIRNLAVITRNLGHKKASLSFAQRAVQLDANHGDSWNTLGIALYDLGQYDQALEAYLNVLKLDENHSHALTNISGIYHLYSDMDNSYIYASRSVHNAKTDYLVWSDHLTYLRRCVDLERIKKINWHELVMLCQHASKYNSFLMLLASTETREDNIRMATLAKLWGDSLIDLEKHEQRNDDGYRTKNKITEKKGRITIAFISPDFRDHSVARFIWPIFEHIDRNNFNLVCLSNSNVCDHWTQRFMQNSNTFINITACNPTEIRDIATKEGVDVMIDLAGFTKGSRLPNMAERMAPVQITWLGYPGTTGIKNIDYIFTDRHLMPDDIDLVNEKLLITEGSSLCFSDMQEVEITDRSPEDTRGFITYGSLNNPYKFTLNTIRHWSSIIKKTNNSKLFLARREYDSYYLRKNLISAFAEHKVTPDRIKFYNNRAERRHYLDCYNEIDICLDTMPLTGGTTTVDSLWMGVPTVTLKGPGMHQRISSTIMHHCGMSNLIANNQIEFEEIALRIAQDKSIRETMRASLREKLKKSSLFDGRKFTMDFSDAIYNCFRKNSS
ncbi:tetratricopeptide repeat protein [Prochlorococcus marinus]|uniref:O-linked N-acetylglucosamine transferase, SPINDLY family protein n=1 Tax=Prochlorococcus TaxID=1218 RepID=UPI0007B327F6|nr:tetratricopeptide repeat protein [Prochlorococcus marinus]KZR78332.1 lipoprotein NlpI [Prochlorococcus marinus str. MIT 1323]